MHNVNAQKETKNFKPVYLKMESFLYWNHFPFVHKVLLCA